MSLFLFSQQKLHERQIFTAVDEFKLDIPKGHRQAEILQNMVLGHHAEFQQHQSLSKKISLQSEIPERPNELLSKVKLEQPVQKYSEESTETEEEWLREVKKCEKKTKENIKGSWGNWRGTNLRKQHEKIVEDAFRAYERKETVLGDQKLQSLMESIEISYTGFYNSRMQRLLEAHEPISEELLSSLSKRKRHDTLPQISKVTSKATNIEQEYPG